MWKRDSVYVLRVLSGIVGAPRAGVMSLRRARKEVMSKDSSSAMFIVEGALEQSACVMLLPIVTIDVHNERITSSLKPSLVSTGSIESKIARAEVVACRHGEVLFVMIGNEYLRTIGFARALSEEETALLVKISASDE